MSYLQNAPRGIKLFLRSLQPSLFGLMTSLLIGLLIVGSQILMLSISGKAYPANLNDLLLQGYANYVIGPLTAAVNSNVVNLVLLAVFWGSLGFLVYEGLAKTAFLLYEWRTVRRSINMPAERTLRKHPVEGYFLLRLAWRFLVVIISLLLTIALLPVIQFCLGNAREMLEVSSLAEFGRLLGVTILWWVGIIHCYLVLLRWYALRTRMTGEILD